MTEETINMRELALQALLEIEQEQMQSHVLIRRILNKYRFLPEQNRAFFKRLVNGVLENQIRLDYVLNLFSRTKTSRMKPLIRMVLRIALYQILEMESVPDSAAVNEAVKLTVRHHFSPLRGFVNGLLRNIVRNKEHISFPDRSDAKAYLSIIYSMPDFLAGYFLKRYGFSRAEQIFAAMQRPAPFTVRIRPQDEEQGEEAILASLEREGISAVPIPVSSGFYHLEGNFIPDETEAFRNGRIAVQDLSSMLAVLAAEIKEGMSVLDLCAAPGGKSLFAADLTGEKGRVVARDLTEWKTDLIRENAQRLQPDCFLEIEEADARIFDPKLKDSFDIVLADLPCSGIGIIGRKPDIRYHTNTEKVRALSALQKEILNNAAAYVKPGGRLVYTTCTVQEAENEENMRYVTEQFSFKNAPVNIPDEFAERLKQAGLPDTRKDGYFQLLPGIHDCDGFFISVMEKEKDLSD